MNQWGSAELFSIALENCCRFALHPVGLLGTLVLEQQAVSNNKSKGIAKLSH